MLNRLLDGVARMEGGLIWGVCTLLLSITSNPDARMKLEQGRMAGYMQLTETLPLTEALRQRMRQRAKLHLLLLLFLALMALSSTACFGMDPTATPAPTLPPPTLDVNTIDPCGDGFNAVHSGGEGVVTCVQHTPPPAAPPSTPGLSPAEIQGIVQAALSNTQPTPAEVDILSLGTVTPTLDELCFGSESVPDVSSGDLVCQTPTPTPTVPTPTPTPVPTATPIPTRTPIPSPTPRIRPVESPDLESLPVIEGGTPILTFTSGPTIVGTRLSMSGIITLPPSNTSGKAPTTIQLWQALYEDNTATCSTERPVAFFRPGSTDTVFTQQTSLYEWQFCRWNPENDEEYRQQPQVSKVPWLFTSSWNLKERPWKYTNADHIWDFSVTADFKTTLALENTYSNPAYWRVIVFSGNSVLAYEVANR